MTEAGAAPGAGSHGWNRLSTADSYGVVLVLVMLTYTASVSITQAWAGSIVLTIQVATVWFTLRTSRARPAVRRVADLLLCLAAAAAVVSFFAHQQGTERGGVFVVCSLLYLIAPFSIVRHLMLRRDVDIETLLGAITAYLLIGMFFAFAYKAVGELGSVPFYGTAGPGSLSQDLFFSFVTMTTVGYGDLVPAANPGQTLAVLEAVIGQLFLVVAVGKIISSFRPRREG
jgi:voltage-gated potassium channel Kch